MPFTNVDDSATVSTTEYFLASDSTTAAYQTENCVLQAWVHIASMASGDQFRIRFYEKVNAIGPLTITDVLLDGPQAGPFVLPPFNVHDGWEVSVIKVAGTDRTVHWSLRKVT